MISYGAWTNAVGSKTELPYFLRTSVANANFAKELNHLFAVFQWTRIGIITSSNPGAIDTAEGIFKGSGSDKEETKKKAGEVVYTGRFEELAIDASDAEIEAAASDRGPNGFATHTEQLKKLGIKIIFISVFRRSSTRALFRAFTTAGFTSTGYAFVATYLMGIASNNIPMEEAEGLIMLEQEFPPCSPGLFCAEQDARNAHDAMYALLRGIGKVVTGSDSGVGYKANDVDSRLTAMRAIRQTVLPHLSSGTLSFDSDSNNRKWDGFHVFGTKRVNKALQFVPVGRLSSNKQLFVAQKSASIVWPGNSSVLPADRDLKDIAPKVVSIVWLEKARSDNLYDLPRIEKYMRWSLARLNADRYFLPSTNLELRHEILKAGTSSAEYTAACERLRREAEAEGKPVVGFISSGTGDTKAALKMASPLPTVSYSSTQAIMENATQYPWLVRIYPSDSQRVDATTQMLRHYKWTKLFMIVDEAYVWAKSLAKGMTDKAKVHGIELNSWFTPHLRDASKLNATKADLAAAATYARAKGFKVIVLAMSTYIQYALRALLEEGLYGEGVVIMAVSNSFLTHTKTFVGADRVVLDASMVLDPSGMDRSLKQSKATMAAWPGGAAAFLTEDATMARTAYTLDALKLFAHSIAATINRDKSPLIAAELMTSLRTTGVQGLTGDVKIESNWNNIRSRGYTIKQLRVADKLLIEDLGVVYTDRTVLQVCSGTTVPPSIGPTCEGKAAKVETVKAFAQNNRTLKVTWLAAPDAFARL